jgi:hypothetical protein
MNKIKFLNIGLSLTDKIVYLFINEKNTYQQISKIKLIK